MINLCGYKLCGNKKQGIANTFFHIVNHVVQSGLLISILSKFSKSIRVIPYDL